MVLQQPTNKVLSHAEYREHKKQIDTLLNDAERTAELGLHEQAAGMARDATEWNDWLMSQDFDFSDIWGAKQ